LSSRYIAVNGSSQLIIKQLNLLGTSSVAGGFSLAICDRFF
jgi:hypothetical protein